MTDWPAYFRSLTKPVEEAPPRPAPEASSRTPWPEGVRTPTPVLKLAEEAREAGWEVALAYSRGCSTYRLKQWQPEEMISVRIGGHPLTQRRCFAIYRRTAGAKPGAWTWQQVYLWGPDLPPFGLCNVTELRDFLADPAVVTKAWIRRVRNRVRDQELAAKKVPCSDECLLYTVEPPAGIAAQACLPHEHRANGAIKPKAAGKGAEQGG